MQGTGPLFLLSLGANPLMIGLLATATNIGNTSRILGLKLMPRVGKARLMGAARVGSGLFLLLLLTLAFYSEGTAASKFSTLTLAWAALVLLVLRQATMQIGGTAWWPLVQDNTPRALQSRFITRMRVTQRICSLSVPLLAGWHLGTQPSPSRFAAPFAVGLGLVLIGTWVVVRVAERPLPIPNEALWKRIVEVMRVPAIRRYCTCFAVVYFAETATMPFWVVALTDRGLPANYYIWMLSVMGVAELLTTYVWGQIVDRYGSRLALSASFIPMALMAPLWLVLPTDRTTLIVWASGFFFLWGMFYSGYAFGQTRAMIDAVPPQSQGEGFAVPMFLLSVAAASGGLCGGLMFDWMSTLTLESTTVEATHWYLALTQLLFLAGWIANRRLGGTG